MNPEPVRVLLIDDDSDDYLLTRDLLEGIPGAPFELEWVDDYDQALADLTAAAHDVYLLDYRLGARTGLDLLREAVAGGCTAPIIMLTGQGEPEVDFAAMQAGAADYLVKAELDAAGLERAIRYALQQKRYAIELERRVEDRTAELFRANNALTVSRERLDLIVQSTELGLWYCDLPFDRLAWNDKCKEFFGLPADQDVTIDTFYERLHPDDRDRTRQAIQRTIDEHIPFDVEYRTVTPEGKERWVRAIGRAFYDPAGVPLRFDGVTVDISEQKRAAEELARLLAAEQRRTTRLRQLANAALTINAATSLESLLQIVTSQARNIIPSHQAVSSLTVNEEKGQTVHASSFSERYSAWQGDMKPAALGLYQFVSLHNQALRLTQAELESHPAFNAFETQISRQPPLRGWLGAPFIGRDGRNLGVIQLSDKAEGEFTEEDEAILTQLALIASVAIENARLVEALREADRRKDEFLAMLAHELRNPLAPIRNTLHSIRLRGAAEDHTLRQDWERIERHVEHMVRLVDDLLDVSRITHGRINLQKQHTGLATIVQRALESSRPLIEAREHHLEVRMPDDKMLVDADIVRLAQVLLNLLNNAAKYTPPGGRITIAVDRVDHQAVIRVRDTGVGIPAEMLPRVFDLFTQVERTVDRAEGGLGIGLTLARRLTEMHGGTLEADSRGPGHGSEFTMRLPLLKAAAPPTRRDSPSEEPAARGPVRRILVVDDNRDSAESLATVLRLLGNDVRTAYDGQRTLELAPTYRPTLILLDIGLPGMSGYEVARRLRATPGMAGVMLIALTGFGTAEDRRRSREAGFDGHLVKPLDLEALQELLGRREGAGVS